MCLLFSMCNRSGVLFIFLFPILQCTCFYLAIGDNPKNLKLGIVNEEVSNWQECYNNSLITAAVHDDDCKLTKVSCRYLKDIPPETAIQVGFFCCCFSFGNNIFFFYHNEMIILYEI